MLSMANVWLGVVGVCLIWYATVTVYVGVRGALDIKHMFARLGRAQAEREASDNDGA